MNTKTTLGLLTLAALLALSGCKTRSISDSGYDGGTRYHYSRSSHPFYRGELSEFDLLGVDVGSAPTDEQIGRALDTPGRVTVRKGSPVLLIQSGAMQPDRPMQDAIEKQFVVVPFSGQPGGTNATGYSRALRLAAAQAGCESIMCYWGTLESAIAGNEAKAVSWVPIVGGVFPDEAQQMRIRLKVAIVDVRSGRWAMFSSQSFENRAHSARVGREWSDQKQVEKLKQLGYASVAEDLVKIYAR